MFCVCASAVSFIIKVGVRLCAVHECVCVCVCVCVIYLSESEILCLSKSYGLFRYMQAIMYWRSDWRLLIYICLKQHFTFNEPCGATNHSYLHMGHFTQINKVISLYIYNELSKSSSFFQGPQGEPGPPGQQGNPGAQVSDVQVVWRSISLSSIT